MNYETKHNPIYFGYITPFFSSCKKDEVDVHTDNETSDYIVESLEKELIKSIYTPKNIYNPIAIKFNYPIDTLFKMNVEGEENYFRILYEIKYYNDTTKIFKTVLCSQDSLISCPDKGLWNNNKMIGMSVSANLEVLLHDEWENVKTTEGRLIKEIKYFQFSLDKDFSNPVDLSITDLTPMFNNTYIPPFTSQFALRLNVPFDIPQEISPTVQYKLAIHNLSLKDKEGQFIETELSSDNNDVLITTKQNLLPEEKYTLNVEFAFEVKVIDLPWVQKGEIVTFSTTYQTSFIYNEDDLLLKYSYPALNQYHFLKDEYPKGYLRFSKLPDALKQQASSKGNRFFARITHNKTKAFVDIDCTYSPDSLYFEYSMSSSFLGNGEVYEFSLFSTTSKGDSLHYYSYFFRTSKFNDSTNKLSDYSNAFPHLQTVSTGISTQQIAIYPVTEMFDYWESKTVSNPVEYNTGLIQMEVIPEESSIFQKNDFHTLYETLAKYPQALKWRTPEMMGIPPRLNTGYVFSIYGASHPGYLTPELIEQGAEPIPLRSGDQWKRNYFSHNFSYIAQRDYMDLKIYFQTQDQEIDLFIIWFLYNNLRFKVNYVLPGLNIITSTTIFNFHY